MRRPAAQSSGRKAVTGISVRSERRCIRAGYPLPPAMATAARQVDGATDVLPNDAETKSAICCAIFWLHIQLAP